MNYLDRLSKNIKHKQKKQKVSFIKGLAVFSVISIAVGGVAKRILAQNRLDKRKNTDTNNSKTIVDDISAKREEIKQTLEEFGDEVVGDVGFAMEKALDNLEDKKETEFEK